MAIRDQFNELIESDEDLKTLYQDNSQKELVNGVMAVALELAKRLKAQGG